MSLSQPPHSADRMNAATLRGVPPALQQRLAGLSARERLSIGAGIIAVLLFLLWLSGSEEEEPSVELTSTPPPAAAPVITTAPPPPPSAAPVVPPASPVGLVLNGVFRGGSGGGSAVIGFPGGGQRLVRIGKQIQPGLTLKDVGDTFAVISTTGGDYRLAFGQPAELQASAPPAAPAPDQQVQKQETMALRLGLDPVQTNGRISGYRIKQGVDLPHLNRAGLQPGDVILGVNGSALDEERLMELSWQIANSTRTEFEFMRGGRKMKVALEGTTTR